MENRYCVIMSGGIGRRFWPFSRTSCPKQFLDFFGSGRTLLQMTYDRLSRIIPTDHIFIVTNEAYAALTHEQLPEVAEERILLESHRRNTAPCIAWATYHIKAIDPDAVVLVAPSDHLILREDEFRRCIDEGFEFVARHDKLLTLGITPNRPETGYGYIQVGEPYEKEICSVKTFVEKPNYEMACVLLESGEFYWNSGMFLWSVNSITRALERYLPNVSSLFEQISDRMCTPDEKAAVDEAYNLCPVISIDFGVMEKADNVCVMCADFGWSDIGTWGGLYDVSPKNAEGNVTQNCKTLMYDSRNNLVAVKGDRLVVIDGLSDFLVAEADDVLLICPKDNEQRIRQFVTDARVKFDDKYI